MKSMKKKPAAVLGGLLIAVEAEQQYRVQVVQLGGQRLPGRRLRTGPLGSRQVEVGQRH